MPTIYARTCASCGLLNPNTKNTCLLTNFRVDPSSEYCSKHASSLERCELCGQVLIRKGIVIDGPHLVCENCNQQINHCGTCANGLHCSFNEDPTPPQQKFIQQQTRQGNMTISQQVRNPSLVEKTCKNCQCFNHGINQCSRDFNTCGQYQMKEF